LGKELRRAQGEAEEAEEADWKSTKNCSVVNLKFELLFLYFIFVLILPLSAIGIL
jgi:hypothetical protein